MPRQIHRYSAMVGTAVWIAWQLFTDAQGPAVLLLLSPLVLIPLLYAAVGATGHSAPLWRALIWSQLPCALLLPLGMSLDPGAFALLCCIPWAGWTALSALVGCQCVYRLVREGGARGLWDSQLALAAGLAFPLVGSVWLLADRLGVELLGFSSLFVLLTAVHFHHAGLSLPLAAGLLGRERGEEREPWHATAVLIVLAVPLVALGITFSPLLEVVGSLLTVAAAAVVGVGMLLRARALPVIPALLSALSGTALLGAMCFATSYALGEYLAVPWPDIISMIQLHGAVNALGFGLLGAWTWFLTTSESVEPAA